MGFSFPGSPTFGNPVEGSVEEPSRAAGYNQPPVTVSRMPWSGMVSEQAHACVYPVEVLLTTKNEPGEDRHKVESQGSDRVALEALPLFVGFPRQ
jgi:hypothetical protein